MVSFNTNGLATLLLFELWLIIYIYIYILSSFSFIMPNISLTIKGGGHYPEDLWYSQVIDAGVYDEWWVQIEKWRKFMDNLRGINFGIQSSRQQVADYIAALDRDLPAEVDRRFAGERGVLGQANYVSAPLFYRLDASVIADITRLARTADQPSNSRDVELSRGDKGKSKPGNTTPQLLLSETPGRDVQPLRDGALSFSYTLINDLMGRKLPVYSRRKFEQEFGLLWTTLPAAQAHA